MLAEAARRADVSVTFSVPTLDDEVWRTTEPGTAPPRQRLRALTKLVDAGIKASVGMAPILPGLSDRPEQLAEVVRAARAAGRDRHLGQPPLPPAGDEGALPRGARPRLARGAPRYEELYAGGAYLPRSEVEPSPRAACAALAREHGVRDRRRSS